ncbi:hypothetical protein [Pseudochryseolinea flava]|nr:hypothetical protein [Pseudochryseolinea flava]
MKKAAYYIVRIYTRLTEKDCTPLRLVTLVANGIATGRAGDAKNEKRAHRKVNPFEKETNEL